MTEVPKECPVAGICKLFEEYDNFRDLRPEHWPIIGEKMLEIVNIVDALGKETGIYASMNGYSCIMIEAS